MSDINVPMPDRVPSASINTNTASVARVYDAALGGQDNYEIDREVMRRLRLVAPEISQVTVPARDDAPLQR